MKNIVLIGMKGCGKTTVGKLLAIKLSMRFVELDIEVKILHEKKSGERLSCREIFKNHGENHFRQLETDVLKSIKDRRSIVLSCGGGSPLSEMNQTILQSLGTVVFLDTDEDVLLKRIVAGGIPAFFSKTEDSTTSFHRIMETRCPIYEKIATIRLVLRDESPNEITKLICERIGL